MSLLLTVGLNSQKAHTGRQAARQVVLILVMASV